MSELEKQYQKMIETLEASIKDKDELMKAKEQLDDIVSIVVEDCNEIMDRYDEKFKRIQDKNSEYETRITILEEKLRYFEKMVESEDYDFFITCPYCGFEFQTDYDDEIDEIECPECGQIFDIEWDDDSDDSLNND